MLKLYRYEIRQKLCKQCLVCQKICPENAIQQLPDNTLKINPERCTECGLCFEKCNLRVIVKKVSPHFRRQ